MMVATLTNRAVTAILVVSANQNTSSGDMVRNSARSNQEITSCEIGSTAILRSSNFATGMRHLGQKQTFGVVRSRPGNGRFDAQNSSNLFASSIRRIFVTRGCDLGKCGKRHPGGLSYAIVIRHLCC